MKGYLYDQYRKKKYNLKEVVWANKNVFVGLFELIYDDTNEVEIVPVMVNKEYNFTSSTESLNDLIWKEE